MTNNLFITGFLRSGTTLVDKLINFSPRALIVSQPLFYAYLNIKKRFLESLGLPPPTYPLGNLFLQTGFQSEQFTSYLDSTPIDDRWIEEAFIACPQYEQSRYITWRKSPDSPALFCPGVSHTLRHWALKHREPISTLVGSKEVLCEEFIPHLINQGTRVILVIRDPRAVVASIKFGKGHVYANPRLTTLYILRQWRKSIAFALAFRSDSRLLTVRYEDLVQKPDLVLSQVFTWLDLPSPPNAIRDVPLYDQHGEAWIGNSSFEKYSTISNHSLTRYRELLDPDTLRYIEAICGPEMKVSGYRFEASKTPTRVAINNFREIPTNSSSGATPVESGSDPENRKAELTRLQYLTEDLPIKEINRWFLFEKAFTRLHAGAPVLNNSPQHLPTADTLPPRSGTTPEAWPHATRDSNDQPE
ncbi:MAG: sulfotransferase [Verrucomicrobiota bacterium]